MDETLDPSNFNHLPWYPKLFCFPKWIPPFIALFSNCNYDVLLMKMRVLHPHPLINGSMSCRLQSFRNARLKEFIIISDVYCVYETV